LADGREVPNLLAEFSGRAGRTERAHELADVRHHQRRPQWSGLAEEIPPDCVGLVGLAGASKCRGEDRLALNKRTDMGAVAEPNRVRGELACAVREAEITVSASSVAGEPAVIEVQPVRHGVPGVLAVEGARCA
jgi:hypothetical protein